MAIKSNHGVADVNLGLGAARSPSGTTLPPLSRLRRLAALEHEDLAVVLTYAAAIGLVSLAVPIAAQSLVNTLAFTALMQPLVVLSILVFGALCAVGILRALQYKVVEMLQRRFYVRTAHEAVDRFTHAKSQTFNNISASEMASRFLDVALIQKTASTLLLDGLAVILQGLVSLVLLAFYHPALLAFDLLLISLIAFTLVGLGRGGVKTALEESKAKYKTAAWLKDIAQTTHAFRAREGSAFAFQCIDELTRSYLDSRHKHFKVLFRQVVASHLLQAIGTAALLILGGMLVIRQELSLGQLVAAEIIVAGLLSGVTKFGKYLENFYDLTASFDKVGNIIDIETEPKGGAPFEASQAPASLQLDGVAFSHSTGDMTLRNISLEMTAGTHLAILGHSESGKSTLANILYGLRSPLQGCVKIDGVDMKTLALDDLRRHVAIAGVPEIIEGTLLDNLRLGADGLTASALTTITEASGSAEEIAQLPNGIMTLVGRNGRWLTHSLAARLMIARALARRPRLLILDGSLDAVNAETARLVLQRLRAIRPSLTLLVLTREKQIASFVGRSMELWHGMLENEIVS